MTSKMFLDIVGVLTTSKLSILNTFQGGAVSAPPHVKSTKKYLMSGRVKALKCLLELGICILTLLDIRYFLVDLTWGGLYQPPPGKQPSGTFMSSNHLVTDQAHKNGQFHDLKRSKILFNCKRDSRMTQKFQIF